MDAKMKWRFLVRCNSVIFAHTIKNRSILLVLNWRVRDHRQPKPVPNEQCECEWFLDTGFSKPIQPNQFENSFSVNTWFEQW